MEVPSKLQNDALLFKLTEVASCSANARSVGWRHAATVPPEASHEALRVMPEMQATNGDYSKVMQWPPPKRDSCCLLLPTLRCIDQGGEGELADELMLCERDLGWLTSEEEALDGAASTSRSATVSPLPGEPLSLERLRSRDARTLVIDLDPSKAQQRSPFSGWLDPDDQVRVRADLDDPLALLPRADDVRAAVRERLRARTDGRRVRKCIERLLEIAAEPATAGERRKKRRQVD